MVNDGALGGAPQYTGTPKWVINGGAQNEAPPRPTMPITRPAPHCSAGWGGEFWPGPGRFGVPRAPSAKKNCDSFSQESQESLLRLLRLLRQTIAIFFCWCPLRTLIKTNTRKIYNRLMWEAILQTPLGPQKCNALFDTRANIFVLDNQWAGQFSLSYLKCDEPLRVSGFSGQQDHTAARHFAPFLTIIIGQHETNISTEFGILEEEIDLIIPGV